MSRISWVATSALLLVGNTGTALAQSGQETAAQIGQRADAVARDAASRLAGQQATIPGSPPGVDDGFSLGVGFAAGGPFGSGSDETAATTTIEVVGRYMFVNNFGGEVALAPLGLWWTEKVSPFHAAGRAGLVSRFDWFTLGGGAEFGFFQNPNDQEPHFGAVDLYLAPGASTSLDGHKLFAEVRGSWTAWSELQRLNGSPGLAIAVGWWFL